MGVRAIYPKVLPAIATLSSVGIFVFLTMMRIGHGAEYTNIVCTDITPVSNGIAIAVGYESDFTNRLDIFSCDELKDPCWRLGGSNFLTAGTNSITWLDVTTSPVTSRFYVVGNCADFDNDGLASGREHFLYRTDPFNSDTDEDGMPDGWEVDNGFNPLVDDSGGDFDSDGLSNVLEYQNSTNPNDPDSDDDGINDGDEVDNGTDPNNSDTNSPTIVIMFPTNNYEWIWIP